ncbi:hypothetical protein F0U59_15865 [Archangium gephyra]|nr:hypothetical protein F0U59_15865 [Archangium gephyra]
MSASSTRPTAPRTRSRFVQSHSRAPRPGRAGGAGGAGGGAGGREEGWELISRAGFMGRGDNKGGRR